MKYEIAIQQVMSTFSAHKPETDDGDVMVSNLDGLGEVERCMRDLRESIYRNDRASDQRQQAKRVAAMALRFMVDRT